MNKKTKKLPEVKKGTAPIESGKASNDSTAIVVGLGASAGGTKSLKRFFAKMPVGRGAAFILVQYSERQRGNLSVKLFKDKTALAVVEAKDGMTVLTDHIYIIPPEKFLSISGGKLTLQEPVLCNGLRMPIDHFFCSLALDQRHRSIAVLLSGKGSDGTLGLSEIKAAGGRTFAEDPASAEYPGMPQSAIDAGVAGRVMPAEALAEAVIEMAGQLMVEPRALAGQTETDPELSDVLDILRAKVGHDFRCYKPSTLIRRIKRRMSLAKISSMDVYARFLKEHPEEVGLLQKDLLIGVTDFFRQPHAWETLEEKAIASIVEGAQPGSEIRAWVPGCSTGKEAYSLAMVLDEQVEKSGKKVAVQIFATDSDLASLATARSGIYAKEEFGENVSSGRLKRFFVRKDGRYQVAKNIRERIVFAPQNITADPPFSRLDLISCRNLLIYLDQEVQKKIIALFHFALREGGFLFLGTAETVGDREELFEPVSKKWRIYRRIGVGRRVGVEIPVRPTAAPLPEDYVEAARTFAKAPLATPPSRMSLTSGAQHMLLDRFAPACVMIDRKLHVLYVHGAVEDYLTFPPGELTTRVVDMAREGLRARLRGAIAKCLQSNKSVSVTARVRRGEKSIAVRTVVSPLRYPREIDGLLLITFEDYRIPVAKTSRDAAATGDIRHLEDELKITREELQSTIEQLENSNDELKASNEEVTAANEELQSANEELETSKEELQSLNEELNTINVRLHEKVDELEGVNNDVINLLSSTSIATVFLDRELKVKRYTPASTRLMSLIPTDAGRHVADILLRFSDEMLLDDARLVLADLTPLAREVQADDGRWYIRRITPYRTQDDRIEGVVITFVDVADLKEAEEALRNSEKQYRELVQNANSVIIRWKSDGTLTFFNEYAQTFFGYSADEVIGKHVGILVPNQESTGGDLTGLIQDIVAHPERYVNNINENLRRDGSRVWMAWTNKPIFGKDGKVAEIFAVATDITERKRAEDALREAHGRAEWLARFPDENPNPVMRVSADGRSLYCNQASVEIPELVCEVGKQLPEHFLPLVAEAMAGGQEIQRDVELGKQVYSIAVVPIPGEDYANIYGRDVTERKRAEETVSRTQKTFFELVERSPFGTYIVDAQFRIALMNASSQDGAFRNVRPVIGRDFSEAMHILWPDDVAEEIIAHFRHTLDTGEPYYSPRFINPRHDVEIVESYEWELHRMTLPDGQYGVICYYFDSTRLREIEKALRESDERLNRAQEIAQLGSWELDLVQNRLTWSDEVYRIFGLQPQEFGATYEAFLEHVHPEDRAAVDAAYSSSLRENRDTYEIEHRVVRKDTGEIRIVHEKCEHFRDSAGKIIRSVGMVHDISERNRLELMLQKNLKEHQDILNSMPAMVFYKDTENRFIRTNKAFEDTMRLPKEALEGKSLFEIYPKEQAEAYWRDDQEVIASGKAKSGIVEPMQTPAGMRIVQTDKVPYLDESGRVIGVIGFAMDITQQRQAEEALQTTLQRLNAVVAGMQSSLLLVGEGRIEMANQAFCDYFGLQDTPADLVGLTPRQLIDKIKNAYLHPDEQVRRIWEIARQWQPVISEEIAMRDGRTSLRDFIPIYVDGKSYGLLWQHIDITERREKEDRIAKLTRLYAALSRVNEAIVRVHDEDSLYNEVCQILSEEGSFPLVWIGQVEEKQIVPSAWYGAASGYLKEIKVETEGHFGQGPTGTSIRENRAVINDDFSTSPLLSPWRESATRFGFRSSAAFPLVLDGKAIASLTLYSSVPGAFDAEHVHLLESLSADISYALDALSQDQLRRAADEAVRESEQRFRLLSETAGRLLHAEEPQVIVADLCRNVMAHLDCQTFFNFLVDEKAGRLHLNACAGIPEEEARAIEWLDYGVAVCGCVAQEGRRIIAEDILHTPDVRTELIKSFGIQAYCCHPLMSQGRLIGTLSFGTKTRTHFTPDEVELMRLVTDLVAVAMQRMQSLQMILHAKEEWERTFDAVPDLVAILDDRHRILRVNKAMAERLGVAVENCIGEACHKAVHRLDYPPDFCPHSLALTDGKEHVAEVHEDCLGGDFLVSATPLTDERGRLIGSVHVARDITELKQAEQFLRERTAELEAANKELESFSYSVSHDLRAPLRAIDGYARMILKKEGDRFDEETMRKFNVIRSSSQMMGQLIDDILTLSRVVKKHLSTSQLEMDAIIREVWKDLEMINPERNIKLTVRDCPVAYGDRTLIKQVYANLLSNAVKFTKDRDPALIETGGYAEENENVYYIRDNGVGFEMEYYDKLFGIFQRLHKPEEFEGTGVGLATVERIVQRHGGRAWAEGKVNEGATFYFTLPRRR